MKALSLAGRRRQSGVTTLTITMLLLAILTVAALFAASSGILEQRTAASEYRYKLAFQAAEAGLGQAAEFVKINSGKILSADATEGGWFATGGVRWQPCTTALPAGMEVDPCNAETNATRRSQLYRYVGTTNGVLPLGESFTAALVDNQTFNNSGGTGETGSKFATTYKTYATLCRMNQLVNPTCTTGAAGDGSFMVTLVSRGQLADESADAIVKESFGTYRSIGRGPDAPLIAAAVNGAGNAQIVPNPNAGDPELPGGVGAEKLSIWAQGDADISSGASFATCNAWAWLSQSTAGETTTPLQREQLGVCFTCSCDGLCPKGLISGNAAHCDGPSFLEGQDILDVDGGKSDAEIPRRDSSYFPQDLFAYTFGVPSSGADRYLEDKATSISTCDSTQLNANSGGLYWYANPKLTGLTPPLASCDLAGTALPSGSFLYPGGRKQIGSFKHPVVLVTDGPVKLSSGLIFYGVIYVRAKAGAGELVSATGSPQVYGSVVLEGPGSMGGTPSLIYNKQVLENILNSPAFLHLAPVAGSWSDDVQR